MLEPYAEWNLECGDFHLSPSEWSCQSSELTSCETDNTNINSVESPLSYTCCGGSEKSPDISSTSLKSYNSNFNYRYGDCLNQETYFYTCKQEEKHYFDKTEAKNNTWSDYFELNSRPIDSHTTVSSNLPIFSIESNNLALSSSNFWNSTNTSSNHNCNNYFYSSKCNSSQSSVPYSSMASSHLTKYTCDESFNQCNNSYETSTPTTYSPLEISTIYHPESVATLDAPAETDHYTSDKSKMTPFFNYIPNSLYLQQGNKSSEKLPKNNDAFKPQIESNKESDGQEHQTKTIRCKWIDCNQIFKDCELFVGHIERVHVDQRNLRDEYTCFWQGCPRRHRPFNARYKLLIHMRVHSGEKPNKCSYNGCDKAFSRLENLKIHFRSHTGERPYQCQFPSCAKAFSNSSDRAKHQRTHLDTKPYACCETGCCKRYTDPSSLRKHMKSHQNKLFQIIQTPPGSASNFMDRRRRRESSSYNTNLGNSSTTPVNSIYGAPHSFDQTNISPEKYPNSNPNALLENSVGYFPAAAGELSYHAQYVLPPLPGLQAASQQNYQPICEQSEGFLNPGSISNLCQNSSKYEINNVFMRNNNWDPTKHLTNNVDYNIASHYVNCSLNP